MIFRCFAFHFKRLYRFAYITILYNTTILPSCQRIFQKFQKIFIYFSKKAGCARSLVLPSLIFSHRQAQQNSESDRREHLCNKKRNLRAFRGDFFKNHKKLSLLWTVQGAIQPQFDLLHSLHCMHNPKRYDQCP